MTLRRNKSSICRRSLQCEHIHHIAYSTSISLNVGGLCLVTMDSTNLRHQHQHDPAFPPQHGANNTEFPEFSNSTEFRFPMNLHDSRVKFVKSLHILSTTPPAWSSLCVCVCAMNIFDALAGIPPHTGIDMDEKQAFQRGVGLRAQQGCTRPLLRLWPWCCCRRSEMACARKGERCGGQLLWERSFQKVP